MANITGAGGTFGNDTVICGRGNEGIDGPQAIAQEGMAAAETGKSVADWPAKTYGVGPV